MIRIEGLSVREPLGGRRAGRQSDSEEYADALNRLLPGEDFYQTLQLSRQGPDTEGKVDVTLKVPVTPGLYERVRVSALLETEDVERATKGLRMREDAFSKAADKVDQAAADGESETTVEALRLEADAAFFEPNRYREANAAPLDRGSYCDALARDRSCSVITFPQGSGLPDLKIQQAADNPGTVSVVVAASDVNVDDVVELVVATPDGVIYRATWSPVSSGAVDRAASISLAPSTMRVCAAARVVEAPMSSVRAENGTYVPANPPDGLAVTCPSTATRWDVSTAEFTLPLPRLD